MDTEKKETSSFNFPQMEKEVLAFWDAERVFEKSLDRTKGKQPFVFFEGPPTANGKPGIHHVLARTYKDVICRYKTMRGFFVERKAGWDTHGLPVELQVEKELKISGKPEIEKFGIKKFNEKCKESVWKYKKEWEHMTRRVGFWLDLEHPYVTYDNEYVESLWWIIKQIWDKKLLYKGYKVVPHCPRCGTALSSHEVAQGYQSVEENSVYVKFKVIGEDNTYILSWTTTPWTLPGNVALAVGADIDYARVKVEKEEYILAKAALPRLKMKSKVLKEMKGSELVDLKYEPLFDIKALQSEKSYHVYPADFVNTDEGTGIVHTAVMYGEDDYRLGEQVGLPKHHTVDEAGLFTDDVPGLAGKFVKDKKVEREIVDSLRTKGLLLQEELYRHDYPFCWRCDTPLLYYAKDSWFIKMSALKAELKKNNEKINWVPGYIKHGRFGEWLDEVKDWAFSRERYWGTPLPIWESADGDRICIGSIEELRALAKDSSTVGKNFDMHRPNVDTIVLVKDGKEYTRVKEVVDVWFDSGCMPFAQWHYPFENKERIDEEVSFPAEYIAEAIDQTRGWFYTLLAVSTLLGKGAPYKNVICLAHIMDAKGKKMSKSRGNVVDPFKMMDSYGADTLRWHLLTMNQPGDVKLFDERSLGDVFRKNWMILWNVVTFWKMHAGAGPHSAVVKLPKVTHVLDRWVIARLHELICSVTKHLDSYEITEAGRKVGAFINDLSTWYVRRSRDRFKKGADGRDAALGTLRYVFVEFSKLVAPFAPFIADALYNEVVGLKPRVSVHCIDWPASERSLIDEKLLSQMKRVWHAVELGHSLRKQHKIKVRQPLAQFILRCEKIDEDLLPLIQEEMNVDAVVFASRKPTGSEFVHAEAPGVAVSLDTTITDELRERGIVRELVRHVNSMRKDARLTVTDVISVYYEIADTQLKGIVQHYKADFCRDVIAGDCFEGVPANVDLKKILDVGGTAVIFGIKKQ
ncbi:MAG: isoleucine--tRNA ligase [Patescibacteria group bacterium]|nr:isoleucine--tRNA ligase [Patescibacteria group bacterium]MDD5715676.1 isoleucine--tRNA ligase [Patescibacteria group bacterium]